MIDTSDPSTTLGSMGPRAWAAIGNLLRISAVFGYLSGAVLGYRAIQLNQQGGAGNLVALAAGGAGVAIVIALVLWNLKGPLIRGNLVARVLVGAYTLFWIVSSLGLGLIVLGVVYLFTGEPEAIDFYTQQRKTKSRHSAPRHWRATGRVGPSGATLYTDPNREAPAGMFNSWTPVQVMDRRSGFARVVAETGQGGWIDLRTLTESV